MIGCLITRTTLYAAPIPIVRWLQISSSLICGAASILVVHAPLAKAVTEHLLADSGLAFILGEYVIVFDLCREHLRDAQTLSVHLANEHARWYALVMCRYPRRPSLPVEGCGVSMRCWNNRCSHIIGLDAYSQICRRFHGLFFATSGSGSVSKRLRTVLKGLWVRRLAQTLRPSGGWGGTYKAVMST